jgi:putative Ca2+/H+ antiporter (TMEM165/GDT1 family)
LLKQYQHIVSGMFFVFFSYKSTDSDDEQRTSFSKASFQRRKVFSNCMMLLCSQW